MTAMLVELADAVADELNAREWALPFDAERSYADWDLVLPEATTLLVDVVPVRRKKAKHDWRDKRDHELTVHVGFRQKFDPQLQDPATGRIPNSEIDQLIELAESVEIHFDHPNHLPDDLNVTLISADLLGDYDRDLLYENRQFVSVLELVYRYEAELTDDTLADLLEAVA
jgi:hypothetical protein